MENFFYEDKFCSDISDLMYELDIDEENIVALPDGWTCKVGLSTLESMFQLTPQWLNEVIYSSYDERFSEDGYESDRIDKAIKQCIDFEKLNTMIPRLWYPNGKDATITKKDLIEYIN